MIIMAILVIYCSIKNEESVRIIASSSLWFGKVQHHEIAWSVQYQCAHEYHHGCGHLCEGNRRMFEGDNITIDNVIPMIELRINAIYVKP